MNQGERAMQEVEYKVFDMETPIGAHLETELNKYAKDGWRLVEMTTIRWTGTEEILVTLVRQKRP